MPNVVFMIGAFPSPCGEKVGINKISNRSTLFYANRVVSVPLRGKGRDQHDVSQTALDLDAVSVPLRGKGRDQLVSCMVW